MADRYFVRKDWAGSSSGVGTESNPLVGALAARNAHGSVILPGDRLIFMGEHGPLGLVDAADFANSFAAGVTIPLNTAATLLPNCGILFGDSYANTSNASNIEYVARGDEHAWHVEMRGGTANAQRQRAALAFQGMNIGVSGWRVAAADYNYIGDGTNRVGTGGGALSALYAAEASFENLGLLLWGTGFEVLDNMVWGSDAFSRLGIYYGFHTTGTDPSVHDYQRTRIERNQVWGAYGGIAANFASVLASGASYRPPRGCHLDVHRNRVWGLRWGDTTPGATVNNTLHHSGCISVTGNYDNGRARATVSCNDVSGDAQDLIEIIASRVDCVDNYVHDQAPTRTNGQAVSVWLPSGANWTLQNYTYGGNGIKSGLSNNGDGTGGYDGTAHATEWMGAGVASGAYSVDQCGVRVMRNRIKNVATTGITTNGAGGTFVHANEISIDGAGSLRGVKLETSYRLKQHWVSANYVRLNSPGGNSYALHVLGGFHYGYVHNNILDGGVQASDYDLNINGASTLVGDKNRLVRNKINLFGGAVNSLTGTVIGAADYVEDHGPTAGGNCDGTGGLAGLTGARSAGCMRDMNNQRYRNPPAAGPRERGFAGAAYLPPNGP